ncbi:2,3,4,5-tetrahydropyridine-2,6-dicarboxylate N-acetyltransferase [Methylobacterium bullatum]|uniref:2,3,4,5-tetrahydropyridine-2,6-dicarboxylate N-acetyltransferase n=1 Tax=Methylobacterium bullatum TaxID=570505 RepID=A0A679JYT7_9HYPH|nr:2,3,4,5-tetrahydropyridine-2,6-dicarboxylate N-acetyltransferase [Methylobacterium bullatum]CAA2144716.1 Chloramphenicol acetyltransferase [Methylobacterium bullatum]
MKTLLHRLRSGRNPHNETRLHLAKMVKTHGFSIGSYSYGRPKVRFPEAGRHLTIGRYCSIADRVEILLGGGHRLDWVTTYPFAAMGGLWPGVEAPADYHASRGDVTIGSDVWLGSGCMILSGVTIGHGAVVGAHAVVSRDVPPYAIVAGNPARVIRHRFDPEHVVALLETAWWDLPPEAVHALVPLLQSDRIDDLIAAARAARAGGVAGGA